MEKWLEIDDSCKLYTKTWVPKSPTKAVILLLHGLGDHCNRYSYLVEYLNENGYKVVGVDQRGWGRTGSKYKNFGCTINFKKVMSDIHCVAEQAKENDKPFFVYGHSMGGLLALHYAFKHGSHVNGVISSGAAFIPYQHISALKYYAVSAASKFFPQLLVSANINPAELSRDPKVVQDYIEDQYTFDNVSLQTAKDIVDNGNLMLKTYVTSFATPVILLHGSSDFATKPEGSQQFYDSLPESTDKKLIMYQDFYHENDREKVFMDVVDWLNSHL